MSTPFGVSVVAVPHGLTRPNLSLSVVFTPTFPDAPHDAKLSDEPYRPLREWPSVVNDPAFALTLKFLLEGAVVECLPVTLQLTLVPRIWHHVARLPIAIGAQEAQLRHAAVGRKTPRTIRTASHDKTVKRHLKSEIVGSRFNPTYTAGGDGTEKARKFREDARTATKQEASQFHDAVCRQAPSLTARRKLDPAAPADAGESGSLRAAATFCVIQERLFQYPGVRERCGFQVAGTVLLPATLIKWDAVYAEPTFPTKYGPISIIRPTIPTQIGPDGWATDSQYVTAGLFNFSTSPGTLGDTIPGVDLSATAVDIKDTSQEEASFSAKGGALALYVPGIANFIAAVQNSHLQALKLQQSAPQAPFTTSVYFNADALTLGFAADLVDLGTVSRPNALLFSPAWN